MATEIKNRFLLFKDDFKKDTGFDFNNSNMSLYIQYYNARCNDISCQIQEVLTHNLLNKIDHLPDIIRLRIAEMITSHDTFKQLLQKKS